MNRKAMIKLFWISWSVTLGLLTLLWLSALGVWGQNQSVVTLSWDANSESDLAGYKIYTRVEGEAYDLNIGEVSAPATQWSGQFSEEDRWFVVTAFDEAGNESGYSNEAKADFAPVSPCGVLATIEE